MDGTVRNVAIVLGILTIAFGGYYLYVQRSVSDTGETQMVQEMLAHTQVFIERSQELDKMKFDLAILEDQRFRSLSNFSRPIKEQTSGRTDPFAPAENRFSSSQ
jgi:Tfp pilus assembly protein PilE